MGQFAKLTSVWKDRFFFVRAPNIFFKCRWTTRKTLSNLEVKITSILCTYCTVMDQYPQPLDLGELVWPFVGAMWLLRDLHQWRSPTLVPINLLFISDSLSWVFSNFDDLQLFLCW